MERGNRARTRQSASLTAAKKADRSCQLRRDIGDLGSSSLWRRPGRMRGPGMFHRHFSRILEIGSMVASVCFGFGFLIVFASFLLLIVCELIDLNFIVCVRERSFT